MTNQKTTRAEYGYLGLQSINIQESLHRQDRCAHENLKRDGRRWDGETILARRDTLPSSKTVSLHRAHDRTRKIPTGRRIQKDHYLAQLQNFLRGLLVLLCHKWRLTFCLPQHGHWPRRVIN